MLKDERMKCIYSLVSDGGIACDVGSDHGFIPIELVKTGKSPRAIMTDISRPSLEKGLANAENAGVAKLVRGYHCDGTKGAELGEVTDIIIAGMGGELIASIIEGDERLKTSGLHFILQPMSRAPELRRYLFENGFTVESETRVRSEGRLYSVISAFYSGEITHVNGRNLYFGVNVLPSDEEQNYRDGVTKALETKLKGIMSAEHPNTEEAEELRAILAELA